MDNPIFNIDTTLRRRDNNRTAAAVIVQAQNPDEKKKNRNEDPAHPLSCVTYTLIAGRAAIPEMRAYAHARVVRWNLSESRTY